MKDPDPDESGFRLKDEEESMKDEEKRMKGKTGRRRRTKSAAFGRNEDKGGLPAEDAEKREMIALCE
jgi:hypothetical protein